MNYRNYSVAKFLFAAVLTTLHVGTRLPAEDVPTKVDGELQAVKVGNGILEVPASWKQGKPNSSMRLAQFALPQNEGDEDVELVVFYFGGGSAGGIQENLNRWEGQFHPEKREVTTVQGKCRDGSYVLSEISGTWKKPDGPPFAQKTIDQPGSRVVSVIWILEKDDKTDHYFLKLSGPDAAVKSHMKELHRAIQADPQTEKPWQKN
ncbi:MAG: hypothetical protein O2931_07660 [Planctomycetota bacterium]|nr:hypothetical protein [Planctomycetota bacterium]MDA1178657.1 hypothetical protein [Planctomycetota bacterium]